MDRLVLSKKLTLTVLVFCAAFVLWPFAKSDSANPMEAANAGFSGSECAAAPVYTAGRDGGSTQLQAAQVRSASKYEPLPPRLLPRDDVETQWRPEVPQREKRSLAKVDIRHVAFPQDSQNVEILPADGKNSAVNDAAANSPQYTWLLQGQAAVPVQTAQRSLELERIAAEADAHTRYGFSLANRGAFYSARAEFVKSLRLLTQGLDAEHQTAVHGLALAAGLAALDEADDFIPAGGQLESELDFQAIINRHRTPVLKLSQPQTLTSLEAMRRYFSFAQYQLGVAGGGEVAGSMALHALAKLYASSPKNPTVSSPLAKPKAVTCFQAALVCYPGNYLAANDLGVLLAGEGRYDDARVILETAAENHPQSALWRNLAMVYVQLGWQEQAAAAQHNQQVCRQREIAAGRSALPGASDPRVCWLSPAEFAKTQGQTLDANQPLPSGQSAAVARNERAAAAPPQLREQPKDGGASPVIESKSSSRWSWNVLDNMFK